MTNFQSLNTLRNKVADLRSEYYLSGIQSNCSEFSQQMFQRGEYCTDELAIIDSMIIVEIELIKQRSGLS